MAERLTDDIVPYLPHLRAFARMLAQDRALADDLVQETVLRALSHAHQFQPGTNLKAWLTTILRNAYFTEKRSQGRIAPIDVEAVRDSSAVSGGQEWHLRMRDFEGAFSTLSPVQREALVLVGASGFSYEQAAAMARCAVGTMKSRVSRARLQLQTLLDGPDGAHVRNLSWNRALHLRDWEHLTADHESRAS
ncbi:MAG: sigma-70 family RNA polymerase sigma factor [Alphaproteobacteria bacterium]|nr:sigma-70 family RNA polymerase sigma factor [Alphaproteobacteria bacterium]MDE1932114.1 sigma-70 family RNA polymerase sigma factor [Alphaproteobacteria bacterium]